MAFAQLGLNPQVVKAIEALGTRSGATAKEIEIADCGEL